MELASIQRNSLPSAYDTQALKQVWKTVNAASCPHIYNFHMHSTCSDGQLSPGAIMEQAVTIGLRGMAITDHHTVAGFYQAQRWLHESQPEHRPHLWTGVEINTALLDCIVHILGYGFEPQHPAIAPYLTGVEPEGKAAQCEQVIAALHQAGGLAVLAHPARYRQTAEQLIPAAAQAGVDGVEAYYAYRHEKPWQATPQTTPTVLGLAQQWNLFSTCGTDSHGLNLLLRV
jgi:hypothetical protein